MQDDDAGSAITVTVTRAGNSGSVTSSSVTIPMLVPGATLAEQLSWVRGFGQSGNEYIVEISGNVTITGTSAALPAGRSNITVRIRGREAISEVRLSTNGILFTIGSGVTLVLDENITLMGRGGVGSHDTTTANNNSLVRINSGGTLIMNEGARVVGNATTNQSGAGVFVASNGRFTMNGGEISGNRSGGSGSGSGIYAGHGGVHVGNGGMFTMNYGIISGNSSSNGGAGVSVGSGGMFTMTGGRISGNRVTGSSRGGGVFVAGTSTTGTWPTTIPAGIFRISKGIIHGNESAVAEELRNTSGDGLSASLHNGGTAQRGTFSDGTFTPLGDLNTTNITINVANGELSW